MSRTSELSLVEQFNSMSSFALRVAKPALGVHGLINTTLHALDINKTLNKIQSGGTVRKQHADQLIYHLNHLKTAVATQNHWLPTAKGVPENISAQDASLIYANNLIDAIKQAKQRKQTELNAMKNKGYSLAHPNATHRRAYHNISS